MSKWIDRVAALTILGVRSQTLYAYVSRGQIGVMPDPQDSRRSLYRAEDINAMKTKQRRGRGVVRIAESTMNWGEPAIETGISTIHHGTLIYRDQDALEWARTKTLEETAALLWRAPFPIVFAGKEPGPDAWSTLSAAAAVSQPILGRALDRLRSDAAAVIGSLARCFGSSPAARPVHERMALGWSINATNGDRIRRALVVLADHELNASTFAARVAASTGASVAASLLAGLSALSGPRHGGASAALLALLGEADRVGAPTAINSWLARGQDLPGFGHPLYAEGDPRAAILLEDLPLDPLVGDVLAAVEDVTGQRPNIDFALVALTRSFALPENAPFGLFILGRSVGWAAHAMEQITMGGLIRPRARYTGTIQTS